MTGQPPAQPASTLDGWVQRVARPARVCLILIVLSVLAVFGRGVRCGFVYDDSLFLVNNESIRALSDIPHYFFEPSENLYRPVRSVLYNLAFHAFGLDPWKYHLLAIVLHACFGVVVFKILLRLLGRPSPYPALVGTLFCVLHPLQVEKVIFVTSGFDIFGDLFCLLAFLRYLQGRMRESRWCLPASVGWAVLGFFTTETALVFPLLVGIYELFPIWPLPRWSAKNARIAVGAVLALLLGYLAVRTAVLGRVSREDLEGADFFTVQASMGFIHLKNWIRFLFPFPHEPFLIRLRLADPSIRLGSLAAWGAVAVALAALFRWRGKWPFLWLGFLWFQTAYLPNSNLIFTGTLFAERYLYLPSVGWGILAGGLAGRYPRSKIGFLLLVVLFSAVTLGRIPAWKSEESLLDYSLQVAPSDPYLRGKKIFLQAKRENRREAKRLLLGLLQNDDWKWEAKEELSAILIDEGQPRKALTLIGSDYETTDRPLLLFNWAVAYCKTHPKKFAVMLDRVGFSRRSGVVFTQLGICFAGKGRIPEAERAFYRAVVYGEDPEKIREYLKNLHPADSPESGGSPGNAPLSRNGFPGDRMGPDNRSVFRKTTFFLGVT